MKRLLNRVLHLEEINGNGICPTYLYRWTLVRFGSWFSIYLHKFVGDDWSRDPHDHPKRFISIGIRGSYVEWTPELIDRVSGRPMGGMNARRWTAPWVRTFPAEHVHNLTGPTPEWPCWTIVIVGKAVRPWGFWVGREFIPWRRYVNSPKANEHRSCP